MECAEPLVLNLRTTWRSWVDPGGREWPLTVNRAEYANAYTASLYCTYIRYLSKELGPLPAWARPPLRLLLAGLGEGLKWGRIDQVVQFNNWLLSTNPVPARPDFDPVGMRVDLCRRFPEHALVWRGLNRAFHGELLDALSSQGWHLIPSRRVYVFDGERAAYLRKRDVQQDVRLLEDGQCRWRQPQDRADWAAVAELYDQLYRQKYPPENPQFTPEFFQRAALSWGWEIWLLVDARSGWPLGVTGWWLRDDIMIGTVVGYQLTMPQGFGLYRRLMTRVLLEAAQRRVWLNMSSGAGAFKRSRGGQPCDEFMAVYSAHLPWARRLPFQGLERLLNRLGLPLLRRYA